jgi:hypothetical protein
MGDASTLQRNGTSAAAKTENGDQNRAGMAIPPTMTGSEQPGIVAKHDLFLRHFIFESSQNLRGETIPGSILTACYRYNNSTVTA